MILDVNKHYSDIQLMECHKQDLILYIRALEDKWCQALNYIDKLLERNETTTQLKNKNKYKLTDLKIKLTELPKHDYEIPKKHWKIQVIKDSATVETINLKGGTMTDLLAWLEENCE